MASVLAYAENPVSSNTTTWMVLIAVAALAVIGLLAVIPIAMARRRAARGAEVVAAGAMVWGLVTVGSVLSTVQAQFQWAGEQARVVREGYYPQTAGGGPGWPWWLWGGLAVGYGVVVWVAWGRGRMKRGN